MQWSVYMLRCSDNSLYTGITTDINRRFQQHSEGKGARYFRGRTPLQVVCGAKNYQVGDKIPLATVGAELPGGMKIGKARMRDVDSFGMLCSSKELGLTEESSGLLILDPALKLGTPIAEALGLDVPRFLRLAQIGPDHAPRFRVRTEVGGRSAEAEASTIKGAEAEAARILLAELDREKSPGIKKCPGSSAGAGGRGYNSWL